MEKGEGETRVATWPWLLGGVVTGPLANSAALLGFSIRQWALFFSIMSKKLESVIRLSVCPYVNVGR